MNKFTLTISCMLSLLLPACGPVEELRDEKPVMAAQQVHSVTEELDVAATVNGDHILLSDIDRDIQLSLFDLKWRQYQLRKAALEQKIKQISDSGLSGKAPSVEVLLTPPMPPRIKLPDDQRAVKGNADAEIRLSLFCSFQSSHCARLQPELDKLEARYPQMLSIAFYDLPQRFHRYGKSAANANLCAQAQGGGWRFQAALYSDIGNLKQERYLAIAGQLGLDRQAFIACLEQKHYQQRIDADIRLAGQLGLGNVPVLFVNGLYVKGPNSADAYGYYINQELIRLGLPVPSLLPLTLVSTSPDRQKQKASAGIRHQENLVLKHYSLGEEITENVTLSSVEASRVIINHQGRSEFLLLSREAQQVTEPEPSLVGALGERELSLPAKPEAVHSTRREPPKTGTMELSADWLDGQLANQEQLAEHFQAAPHKVEGVHLLKLHDVGESEFYQTLGLKSGDVVLQVNDLRVHEQSNPLWQELAQQEEIKLLLMRKGLPVRLDYQAVR